jgi:putrescine transport system substrate-binding protein
MRHVAALFLLLGLAGGAVAPTPALAQDRVVNFYNWSDYIDPKVLQRFTAETGIKVQYDVYDSLETLEGKLLAGRSGYDIVVPTSEPTFSRLITAKALLPLDKARIPNLANLDPKLMHQVATSDPGNQFGAIYLWGTIGLGMVPELIRPLAPAPPLDSWALLLDPANAKLIAPCGITMMDSAIDTIPSVLRYLGRDPESTEAKDLADVERTLMAVRPYIRTFASGGAVEALAGGQTCLAMTYSGDVIQATARAQEAGQKPVRYAAPKEFAQLSFDVLAVPRDAPHAADAMLLINYLLRPDVMAAITNKVRYANAVPASLPDVGPAIRQDENVFPPEAAMARFFTVKAPPQAAERARTRMWARFKAGK